MSHSWRVRTPWSRFYKLDLELLIGFLKQLKLPIACLNSDSIVAVGELDWDCHSTAVYMVCLHTCSPASIYIQLALTWPDLNLSWTCNADSTK